MPDPTAPPEAPVPAPAPTLEDHVAAMQGQLEAIQEKLDYLYNKVSSVVTLKPIED